MKESAVLFGRDQSLVGVVTDGSTPGRTGLVLLNAGFTHHVGPQRIHVQLARRLAESGITSLRFDYSGIGDSPRRAGASSFAERAIAEACEAMDFLESTRGIVRFLLFGICWGADNAMRVAAADDRVVGVAAVDFYAVISSRYFLRFYLRRLLSPRSWTNILRGKSAVFGRAKQLASAVARSKGRGDTPEAAEDLLPVRSPAQVLGELDQMVQRGTGFLFAYATVGGSYDQYVLNFRQRMRELAKTGRVSVRVFAESDHVFTPLHSQSSLCQCVEEWVDGTVTAQS